MRTLDVFLLTTQYHTHYPLTEAVHLVDIYENITQGLAELGPVPLLTPCVPSKFHVQLSLVIVFYMRNICKGE